jgi:large-conductance mechanosensitive channel
MAESPSPIETHAYSITREAKQLLRRINITNRSPKVGKMDDPTLLSPETKHHHENMALYMFAGLVVTFVLISTVILFVELYRNGRCLTTTKQKRETKTNHDAKETDIEMKDIS